MARTTIDLEDLGVVVHPRSEWPHVGLSYETKYVVPKYEITFHTTQDRVSAALVEEKRQQLRAGKSLAVTVVSLQKRIWVIDGHHALVAYLLEGLPPRLAVHGAGPYYVNAPRFVARRRR
jgi:hypothetical protein